MAHGNALDAREKRISELKWLLEIEFDPSKKNIILGKIKEIILADPPVSIDADESDDDKDNANIPSSAKNFTASSSSGSKELSVTPITELWGDEADSDCFSDVHDEIVSAAETANINDNSFDKDMTDDEIDQTDLIAAEPSREIIEKEKCSEESEDDTNDVDFFAPAPCKKIQKKRKIQKKYNLIKSFNSAIRFPDFCIFC